MSAPRGSRGRPRGRGARGRGGTRSTAAAEASQAAEANQAPEIQRPAPEPAPPSIADAPPAESGPSPAASAAPAVVPAPTARPTTTTTSTASTSKSSGLKFKPKVVRRSQEERERIAREQEALQAQRNADEARYATPAARSRGRGRGRGRGALFRGGSRVAAAGPLSSGMSINSNSAGGSVIPGYHNNGFHGPDRRINADTLYTVQDIDDDDIVDAKDRPKKPKVPMPMGIRRVEHEEQKVTLTSAADIEAQEKGQAGGDDSSAAGSKRDDAIWEHAKPKTRAVPVKDEDDGMDLDNIPEGVIKTPESPELKKVALHDTKEGTKQVDTEEEIEAQDRQTMLDLFVGENSLEGHMFLIQFPLILPPLKPAQRRDKGKGVAKAEVVIDDDDDDDDGFIYSSTHRTLAENPAGPFEGPVKMVVDDDDLAGDAGNGLPSVGGYVGQLVVRKSGKVELDWGSVKMAMCPSLRTSFLRTAVLIDDDKGVKPEPGRPAGKAHGMGRIQGSFGVTQIWGEAPEWEVDPAELQVAEK